MLLVNDLEYLEQPELPEDSRGRGLVWGQGLDLDAG